MTSVSIPENYRSVLNKLQLACQKRSPELSYKTPRLVAVSKIKPIEDIICAYQEGQRHFGENYVQELLEKAYSPKILENCKDIRWHLIGHLQSNKINKILAIPNLYFIETVDNQKLAAILDKQWLKLRSSNRKLNIFVQINTSVEEAKSGIEPSKATELVKFILENCEHLKFKGLMTIGQYYYDVENGPNPDFLRLLKCREEVANSLNLNWRDIDLSMGMSADFEQAIELGSTNVRVGEVIFGPRATNIVK